MRCHGVVGLVKAGTFSRNPGNAMACELYRRPGDQEKNTNDLFS